MLRLALMVGTVALAPRSAFALSNAAAYLASQEIGTACGGASGRKASNVRK